MINDLGDTRPWGKYEVIVEEPNYKVKRITVNLKQRLSLQYHQHRSEVWVIVEGKAIVTIGDKEIFCEKSQFVEIPAKAKHRIQNPADTDLVFIEVQNGDYLGEDDIVRIEDDYNR